MDWWKQMLRDQQLENQLGLSDTALSLLAEDFHRFQLLREDLPQQVLRYVVDGQGDEVLGEVLTLIAQGKGGASSGLPNNTSIQKFYELGYGTSRKARSQFLQTVPVPDAAFYCRLAQLYSAQDIYQPSKHIRFGAAAWLDPFLTALIDRYHYSYEEIANISFEIGLLQDMLTLVAEDPGKLVDATYLAQPDDWQAKTLAKTIAALRGFADYSLQYPDRIRMALSHTNLYQRLQALEIFIQGQVAVAAFAEVLVDRATGSAKSERELAGLLLQQDVNAAIPALQQKATTGKAEERYYAVKLLAELALETSQAFLQSRLAVEKAEKVRGAIEQRLSAAIAPVASTAITLPPLAEIPLAAPLSEQIFQALQAVLQAAAQEAQAYYDKHKPQWLQPPQFADPATVQHIFDLLQGGTARECADAYLGKGYFHLEPLRKSIRQFIDQPELALIHIVRLLLLIQALQVPEQPSQPAQPSNQPLSVEFRGAELYLKQYRRTHAANFGLRELAAVFTTLGLDAEAIGREIVPERSYWMTSGFLRWEGEALWPYFAERLQVLENVLNPKLTVQVSYDYGKEKRRKTAFTVLQTFPQPPDILLPKLWEIALSGSKTEGLLAQQCLDKHPDTPARVIKALRDRDQTVRVAAANWLARLNDSAAIPSVRTALQTEKSEAVKDALMRSLEKLGASVDEFLDRDGLLQEAQAGLKKGVPPALSWLPGDRLPTVRWQDTQQPVEREILVWFIVQAYKQKTPEPSPMLRRYVSYFSPPQREQWGQWVLTSWLGQDTLPKYTYAEADPIARKEAASRWAQTQQFLAQTPDTEDKIYQQTYNQYLQHYQARSQTLDEQQLDNIKRNAEWQAMWTFRQRQEAELASEDKFYQETLNRLLAELKGSAIKEKGVLAIAAACAGAAAVPVVQNYLKTYYGQRLAQSVALLQMLSWIEDFSAIQCLLSVANRFRTKKIQDEAERLVNQLAERRGWTRDELGDRTVPWCGFTDTDQMVLDYGSRQFTVRLDKGLNFILTDASGKVLKALPEARKDEDEATVKAAKKQFSDAKKQLKQVLTLQKERLYEAMCTQRTWQFQDWDAFLRQHPIVGRYCQTLVWAVVEPVPEPGNPSPASLQTFRPLEDGSLTDAEDNAVTIAPAALIRLAHASLLPADTVQAWTTHLMDYEVTPLFEQFNPACYQLPADKAQSTEIRDFEGHLLDAFALRGKATKLGYVRGQTEDSGWFYRYYKNFTGLELQAVIEFTGNFLPEENRTVALTQVCFCKLEDTDENQNYYWQPPTLPLGEVPPVLLSEVWHDVRSIAAQGTGFDPDWQKKAAY